MRNRELRRWCDTLDAKHAVLHSRREQRAGRFASALRALKKVLCLLLSFACFGNWCALFLHPNAGALLASLLWYKSPCEDLVLKLPVCPVTISHLFDGQCYNMATGSNWVQPSKLLAEIWGRRHVVLISTQSSAVTYVNAASKLSVVSAMSATLPTCRYSQHRHM